MKKRIVVANWKMHGLQSQVESYCRALVEQGSFECDVAICPPATLLAQFSGLLRDSEILLGGQNCHSEDSGAHTGEISAGMLSDCGASMVIVGHSERRDQASESNIAVCKKITAAWKAGLTAILCIGESESERASGQTLDVLDFQLQYSIPFGDSKENLIVAYEPKWAIGSGKTPTIAEIREVHRFIRGVLGERQEDESVQDVRLLYGGSVNPNNAKEIFSIANVDGGLIGGASLNIGDFTKILKSASHD